MRVLHPPLCLSSIIPSTPPSALALSSLPSSRRYSLPFTSYLGLALSPVTSMARHPAATVLARLPAIPRRKSCIAVAVAAECKAASQLQASPRRAYSTHPAASIPSPRRSHPGQNARIRSSHRQQSRLFHALQRAGSSRIPRSNTTAISQASQFSTSTSPREESSSSSSSPPSSFPPGPKALYHQKVKQGLLKEDPRQLIILEDLQAAYDGILNYKPPPVPEPLEDITSDQSSSSTSSSPGFFARLFGRSSSAPPPVPAIPEDVPKSLYLFGDVGCGKSMLMDLLYEALPASVGKRRVHFHAFMIDVHKRLHKMAADAESTGIQQKGDAIVPVARELAKDGRVLCFDEFQVTDIADAMILRRLMESMIGYGFVIVITSNRAPKDLYKNGIQRASFVPCIKLIETHFKIKDLDSEIDYRKIPRALSKVYYNPISSEHRFEFIKVFEGFTNGQPIIQNSILEVWGRKLIVPRSTGLKTQEDVSNGAKESAGTGSVAMFTFEELCGDPLSAADYLEIVKNFDTVLISDIPNLSLSEKDKARRFITFIDAAYDSKTKLLTLSQEPITQIFSDTSASSDTSEKSEEEEGYTAHQRAMMDDLGLDAGIIGSSSIFTGDEEIFAFARAVSRLSEMGTRHWAERTKGA